LSHREDIEAYLRSGEIIWRKEKGNPLTKQTNKTKKQ
jgi:hypothetical protein